MMVVRLGDINPAGGKIGPGVPTVLTAGLPTCIMGSVVTPHPTCPINAMHCLSAPIMGSTTVITSFLPTIYTGVVESCGHFRITGAPTVLIGP